MTNGWTDLDLPRGGPERDEIDGWSDLSDAERERLERLDLEILGLLPLALEPVEPSAGHRAALLDRIAGSKTVPFPAVERRPASRRWLLPLAATLAFLALGMAAGLYSTVRSQRLELAALSARVEALTSDSIELAMLKDGLADARENLQLVSTQGVQICPLRPVEGDPEAGRPYGLLFVASDHQHWYVRVTGLPSAPDRYYRLWFEAEDGTFVPAGNLLGDELELSSPSMPEGTRAAHVTVETEESPQAPSGQVVLTGNDMIRVL